MNLNDKFLVLIFLFCLGSETTQCQIKQISADPCQLLGEVCKLKRAQNATITIDFTPGKRIVTACTASLVFYFMEVYCLLIFDFDLFYP